MYRSPWLASEKLGTAGLEVVAKTAIWGEFG
jgi:hypothetical protein